MNVEKGELAYIVKCCPDWNDAIGMVVEVVEYLGLRTNDTLAGAVPTWHIRLTRNIKGRKGGFMKKGAIKRCADYGLRRIAGPSIEVDLDLQIEQPIEELVPA